MRCKSGKQKHRMALYSKKKALKPLHSPSLHKCADLNVVLFVISFYCSFLFIYVIFSSYSNATFYTAHFGFIEDAKRIFFSLFFVCLFQRNVDISTFGNSLPVRLVWVSFKVSLLNCQKSKKKSIKMNTCAQHARYKVDH